MTVTAAVLAFLVDAPIGFIGLRVAHVPKGLPPVTLLPILFGTVGGALLASITYAVDQAVSKQAE